MGRLHFFMCVRPPVKPLEHGTTGGHRRRNLEEDCDNHLGQRLDMLPFAIQDMPGKKRS